MTSTAQTRTKIDPKQRCFEIVERFPPERLDSLADSLEAMHKMLDDALDDAFCLQLYRASFHEGNKEGRPFEDLVKELGLDDE